MQKDSLEDAEYYDLQSCFEDFCEIIKKVWIVYSKVSNRLMPFRTYSEALEVIFDTIEIYNEELLAHKSCGSLQIALSESENISEGLVEELLRKGYTDEGYKAWKDKNFSFIQGLSAGTNFHYLRQVLLHREMALDKNPGDKDKNTGEENQI